ncbi:MAG TPA: CDP-2,3-bis-(O-geranylgeranyl)-sn-glycerol synthase [Thermofilum sp.]|nr:CDP-2,3-bis-(O-geranylgeranyl)-sn-glycerol synthase [Thermofilum sp.]
MLHQSLSTVLDLLVRLIIFYLPAYVANGSPVLFSKIYGSGHPIDMGIVFPDGRRLLGDGKTFEGFFTGTLTGSLVGLILTQMGLHSMSSSITLSLGAMIGDSFGSFIKRRLGFKRGEWAPLLDELPFILIALGLHQVFVCALPLEYWIVALLLTPVLHKATNIFAEYIGLRS